jgi:uncharacterized protein
MDLMKEQKFGYGCMRLPVLDANNPASFDYEKIEVLFDNYLQQGFTYFDTAYTYHGYHAEEAIKKALVNRYPRTSFQLATKMPLRDFKDTEDLQRIFDEQCKNCGVEYFDFYLLHNMGTNVYQKCCNYGAFDFVQRMQKAGKIKVVGMSFHDTPQLLDEILAAHGEGIDFVQLQINYVDWEQPNVQSRRCLEVANQYHKPVIVMEPCKGGTLANLPEEAEKLLKAYNPKASIASWAMRFAASQPGVFRVLSGMNTLQQVSDNAETFKDFQPLNEEEWEIIRTVTKIINDATAIPCTACAYCTHGCPKKIAIPQYFALYNSIMRTTGSFSSQMVYYNNIALQHGRAGDCIGCKQCERTCPQHLPIVEYLKVVAEKFEKQSFPGRK